MALHLHLHLHFSICDTDADAGSKPSVIPVKQILRRKVIQKLQQTLHNIDLCIDYAIVTRRVHHYEILSDKTSW